MWFYLAFLSAFLLGFYDVFKKRSLRDNAVIPVLFLNTLFCVLLFFPLIIGSASGLISENAALYIPSADWASHKYILLKAVIVLSSWILGYFGIKHLPITLVGPINATRPVMVLLGALIIFGETLNLWQWAGVVLAIVSFYLLSRTGRKEGIRFSHNRWIYFVVGAAILGAVSGLYDKYLLAPTSSGGRGLPPMVVQAWYNFYQLLLMGIILLTLWYPHRQQITPFRWNDSILMISLCLTAADFVYFYALSCPGAMVSVVSMIRRSSVLVSFGFGALMFHERHLRAKFIDLLLLLLSMVCLWMGTT